jgi:hypothetical protein
MRVVLKGLILATLLVVQALDVFFIMAHAWPKNLITTDAFMAKMTKLGSEDCWYWKGH